MNYQGILETLENEFQGAFPNVIIDIKERISAGSTGSEIVMMVGKYLRDLEKSNPRAYTIVRDQIKEYLTECRRNGLIIT